MNTSNENDGEMINRLREKLRKDRETRPLEATREFLHGYVDDNDWEDIRREIEDMMKFNPWTVIKGLNGIESLLANLPEEGVLTYLVACDANWVLDEPNDENSARWLHQLAEFIREVMGDKQPPRET